MSKTYVPTARVVMNECYNYLTRWQMKMLPSLTAPQITCLGNLINALAECIAAFGPAPIED